MSIKLTTYNILKRLNLFSKDGEKEGRAVQNQKMEKTWKKLGKNF